MAYAKTNNYPEASKAFEAEINDGFLEEKELPGRIKAVAQMNYQIKNYDKAIEYGNRAIKGGFADEEMKTLVGQSYYLKGDYKGTLKYYDAMVDQQIKAGQTPKDEPLAAGAQRVRQAQRHRVHDPRARAAGRVSPEAGILAEPAARLARAEHERSQYVAGLSADVRGGCSQGAHRLHRDGAARHRAG